MSRLTRVSLLLAVFFALDKGAAILRQVIIGRQFGLSAALDAFNVANNVPDMLYALISGGALAVAFIPVLSETLTQEGRQATWDLFSRIANLAFIVTGGLAIIIFLVAEPLVRMELGIAPGFGNQQQALVIQLMRLNLLATLIFSISGLVMAGLQANQHFLLPAMAPLLYNFGQIFGALILAPDKEYAYTLAGIHLPALGMGVHGLVYGVILGALLHLAIQIPGLILHGFHWTARIGLNHPKVLKVLRLMGPRLVTVFFVQLIFLVRDNLASRLSTGAVTALTYGWMIQQVPETLIGTAMGTALLPSLAELVSRRDAVAFQQTVERAVRSLLAATLPAMVIISLGLRPILDLAFGFNAEWTDLMLWTTRAFLLGLVGHSLLEIAARSFYAQQDALTPMTAAAINLIVYILLGSQLYQWLGAPGISLTDSLAYTIQSVFLLILLTRPPLPFVIGLRRAWGTIWRWIQSRQSSSPTPVANLRLIIHLSVRSTLIRSALGSLLAGLVIYGWQSVNTGLSGLVNSITSIILGALIISPFIWRELRLLVRL